MLNVLKDLEIIINEILTILSINEHRVFSVLRHITVGVLLSLLLWYAYRSLHC
jgi:hypothetical protein